jgi:KaiC/GvpD/RAD55 family RecA-like ATPase
MTGLTRLGIPPFDERYGGVYHRRPLLCVGPAGSGKTVAALQFVEQGLREDERSLVLTTMPKADLLQLADRLGFGLTDAVSLNQAFVVEYGSFQKGDSGVPFLLPPDAFTQVQRYVETHRIARLVLDPVLPWVAVPNRHAVGERVTAFVRDIESIGATTFATLPEAVSPLAIHLASRLYDALAVVFSLAQQDGHRTLTITRYLGEDHLPPPLRIRIEPGDGIVPAVGAVPLLIDAGALAKEPA